ncbi:sensor histidine kinase [Streptomyces silvisoli]|uniref:GAF domain-containing protein n=1 Tax=Streptomyces silvisoli TaxID=3034235 RepID=A0ABT5ZIV1_9ACTN|nr:GAF domain-containing sensor histidine kinase [Streptomyces silvisoli]MDF3289581.1 GAF domain-containing protein [Streptomyces silvisoli]
MGTEGARGAEHLRRLQLDELLEELQVRVDAARGTRDRVHNLLEAVLSVGRGLELPQVLRGIVEAAVELVDCEYGALGVIAEHQKLSQFVPVGVSEERQRLIGHLPEGHGVLGELIRHPKALRLRELSDHPSSYGFPPHHPPMHSFLGVPIRVRDEVFGNLYLAEKHGQREFDVEDEAVLQALAVAAGIAVENARLYQETRDRQRWMEATAEVTRRLLSGADEEPVVRLIVEHARRILSADLGLLTLPVEGGDEVRVALAVGTDAEIHSGLVLPRQGSFAGAAFAAAGPVTSLDIGTDPRASAGPPRWQGLGPAVAVPMTAAGETRGVVLLARAEGRPGFTGTETAPLLAFAGQAALAMELAERRRDAEQIALLEDRDRIARDLHDLAIQRLFATGMTLQSVVRLVHHPEATERLLHAVDDLDETIKIIRSTIFGLRAREGTPQGLRLRAVQVVEDAKLALGFTPALRMEGLVDTEVSDPVADDAVAVLGEALSNVARHAHARSADVRILVAEGELALTVTDDGRGIPDGARRSGLANLAERAAKRGGALHLVTPPTGGTRLSWRVPLREGG